MDKNRKAHAKFAAALDQKKSLLRDFMERANPEKIKEICEILKDDENDLSELNEFDLYIVKFFAYIGLMDALESYASRVLDEEENGGHEVT